MSLCPWYCDRIALCNTARLAAPHLRWQLAAAQLVASPNGTNLSWTQRFQADFLCWLHLRHSETVTCQLTQIQRVTSSWLARPCGPCPAPWGWEPCCWSWASQLRGQEARWRTGGQGTTMVASGHTYRVNIRQLTIFPEKYLLCIWRILDVETNHIRWISDQSTWLWLVEAAHCRILHKIPAKNSVQNMSQ